MNRRALRQARAKSRLNAAAEATLAPHAVARARELGFSEDEVLRCLLRPEQTYVCGPDYGPDRRMYQRGDLSVVLHEPTRTVITVLLRTARVWTHGVDTRAALPVAT